jgi:hypothetical protein
LTGDAPASNLLRVHPRSPHRDAGGDPRSRSCRHPQDQPRAEDGDPEEDIERSSAPTANTVIGRRHRLAGLRRDARHQVHGRPRPRRSTPGRASAISGNGRSRSCRQSFPSAEGGAADPRGRVLAAG